MITKRYRDGDLKELERKFDMVAPNDEVAAWCALNSRSWTITHEGVVLAIFGVYPVYDAVLQLWGMVSDKAADHGVSFFREAKKLLYHAVNEAGRVNTQVDADHKQNLRFAKLMGFRIEFVQYNAGPGAMGSIVHMVLWPQKYYKGVYHGRPKQAQDAAA